MRVAYVLIRFPNVTATFIMDELLWIRRQGVDIEILSLLQPEPGPVHTRSQQLMPFVHYAPVWSTRTLAAFFHFLLRRPIQLARALFEAIRYSFREPKMLLMTLRIIPKSVYFARLLEGRNVEHIHAHFVTVPSVAGSIVSTLLGVGLTIQPHAVGLFSRNQKSVRSQLAEADRIVTISGFHRDYISDLCPRLDPGGISIVHCGIETGRFIRGGPRRNAKPFRVLSVGRLVEKKGHGHLIDACALLASRGVEFRCEIVGSGPLELELRNDIERHGLEEVVTLVGAMDQKEILSRYQSSDVFSLACVVARNGDRDGVPVSLMEAMACELPVVTTPVTGIPDLVEHEITGLMVEPGDATSLADALERLSDDRGLAADLGRRGREHVLNEFEISRSAAQMATFFREVIESQSQ